MAAGQSGRGRIVWWRDYQRRRQLDKSSDVPIRDKRRYRSTHGAPTLAGFIGRQTVDARLRRRRGRGDYYVYSRLHCRKAYGCRTLRILPRSKHWHCVVVALLVMPVVKGEAGTDTGLDFCFLRHRSLFIVVSTIRLQSPNPRSSPTPAKSLC